MLNSRDEPWRKELRKKFSTKERIQIPRVKMREVAPVERLKSQSIEVNIGLKTDMAEREASRCLDCITPTCITGCPVSIDIPTFIKQIEKGNYIQAAQTLKKDSCLPAVCGRVCPQEKQCEEVCIYTQKLKKESVAIGYLERFAADYEYTTGKIKQPKILPSNNIKVAVVGSGPSGLSFAGDMTKFGYKVSVFEALHELGDRKSVV